MLRHDFLHLATAAGHRRFLRGRSSMEAVQRHKLSQLLTDVAKSATGEQRGIKSEWQWEDFSSRLPVSSYDDWSAAILASQETANFQLSRSPLVRYQPTSGSTSAIKWIPYTKRFLSELDAAISPWVHNLYTHFPALKRGNHYWSMSWVPTEQRSQMREDINDDSQLMSFGKRLMSGLTQSVPQGVSLAQTSDDSLFATLAYLAADEKLAMLSVWSPTFALGMLKALSRWRGALAVVLKEGRWGDSQKEQCLPSCPRSLRAATLLQEWDGRLQPEFFRALWPRLALVSAWDTAASSSWATKLHALLPHAAFQGKGLWATEGVVTFPYQDQFLLAYQSHVYEFQDPDDGRVYAPWELEIGQQVMPLLSTGSGLLRYKLNDLVQVSGFMGGVPALKFLGRAGTVDMVGEKLTSTAVAQAVSSINVPVSAVPVCTVAVDDTGNGLPGYVLLLEGTLTEPKAQIATRLEVALQQHFHYQLARNLNQLAPVSCVVDPAMRERYLDQCRQRGMIEGNIKMESLKYWPGDLPSWIRHELQSVPAEEMA